jgi:hypothetical protein
MTDDLHQARQSTRSLVETVIKAINRAPILAFHFLFEDAEDIADARRIDEACAKYGVCCALHPHMRNEEPEEVERDADMIVGSARLPYGWRLERIFRKSRSHIAEEMILELIRYTAINANLKENQQ